MAEMAKRVASNLEVHSLFEQYHHYLSAQTNLWAMFIVATVTTAGIVVTVGNETESLMLRLATTIGFVSFALGHMHLLYRARSIFITIERQLTEVQNHPLQAVIDRMSNRSSGMVGAFIPHVLIDLAVLSFVWLRPVKAASETVDTVVW